MERKCIKSKDFALTKDKSYDIINENNNFVVLINDKGNKKKYHKTLFEEVKKEKVIVEFTDEQMLNSVKLIKGDISFNYLSEKDNKIKDITLASGLCHSGIASTCSMVTIYTLNDFFAILSRSSQLKITTLQKELLFEKCLRLYIATRITSSSSYPSRVLFSTHIKNSVEYDDWDEDDEDDDLNPYYESIKKVIENKFIVTASDVKYINRNSGNYVSTWIIDITK